MSPPADDAGLLRRAALTVAAQTAAAVLAVGLAVGALAFGLTVRQEHLAQELAVRRAATGGGVAAGVVVIEDGTATPAGADPRPAAGAPAGGSELEVDGREFAVYAVDGADGLRRVAYLDVTAREEGGERLLASLGLAGLIGAAVTGLVALAIGRMAARPLATALAMQRRFVADASHELRTPLAVLHTRAQLLRHRLAGVPAVDERSRAHADRLVADAAALGEVVEDLLLSAELAHHGDRGHPVDLVDLARDVADSMEPHAALTGVTLTAEGPAGPGAVVVTGVRSALRRALLALVDNAVAHSHPGGAVTLRVRVAADTVRLEVADQGDGMDPAQAGRLMARFARGDRGSGQRRRFGLGLALVGEVATAHGGTVTVESAPGRGATVGMALPRIP